jgi:hypothetical protein
MIIQSIAEQSIVWSWEFAMVAVAWVLCPAGRDAFILMPTGKPA